MIVIVLYEACREQVYFCFCYAGLGQKKVSLPLYSDSDDVNHYIFDIFPQLNNWNNVPSPVLNSTYGYFKQNVVSYCT